MKHKILFFSLMLASLAAHSQWLYSYDDGVKVAKAQGKLMFLDFTASWCGPCKTMEANVWSNKTVKASMDRMVMVKVDIDREAAVATNYSIKAVPTLIVAFPDGQVLRIETGYQGVNTIVGMLNDYPSNFRDVYELLFSGDISKNEEGQFSLAEEFQSVAINAPASSKNYFLDKSEAAYKKAMKLSEKKDLKELATKCKIRQFMLNIDRGKPQKTLDLCAKEIEVKENLSDELKCELAVAYIRSYMALNKTDDAKRYLKELVSNKKGSEFMAKYKDELAKLEQ